MIRAISCLLVALSLGGCAYDEINPPPNESMTGPELSHPREPRKSADPPPPMREDLAKTKSTLITQADPAPVHTGTAQPPIESKPLGPIIEPGVVNPLR